MIPEYDGYAKYQALKKIRNKRSYEFRYGLFLLEYGRWERINGVWFEHQVDEHIARRRLRRAIRKKNATAMIEHAIGESYYRQGKYRLASAYFAIAWKKDCRLACSFWALVETLYIRGRYEEVIKRYSEYKELNCTYSEDFEAWTLLLFCYAAIHHNDIEIVKQKLPSLLNASGKVECEKDIYILDVLGLMIYVDWDNNHDVEEMKDKANKLKFLLCPWLNMLTNVCPDMSAVKESIINYFCPAGIFSHLLV